MARVPFSTSLPDVLAAPLLPDSHSLLESSLSVATPDHVNLLI
jgi:hypothetical protein